VVTIANYFMIDQPGPMGINRKIAMMGGSDSHLGEKSASLCFRCLSVFWVFFALWKK
jgi:hypothetical protein